MAPSVPDSATRNRSDSGAESEMPVHDRKRPRLSDGKSDTENDFSEFQSSIQPSTLPPETSQLPKAVPPPRDMDTDMPLPSPTSKVTINTRPLSSQSVNLISPSAIDGTLDNRPSVDQSAEEPTVNGNSVNDAISIASSPSESPEIQVAEVEDFDQHPSNTGWTKTVGRSDATLYGSGSLPIHRNFPLAEQFNPGEARLAIEQASKVLLDSTIDAREHFGWIKDWLVDFVARYSQITDDILDEDREFWATAPNVASSVLRREQKFHPAFPVEDVTCFFKAYTDITRMILEYDTRRLQQLIENSSTPLGSSALMSWQWLRPVSCLVSGKSALLDSYQTYHSIDPASFRRPCIRQIVNVLKPSLMASLLALVDAISMTLPKYSRMHKELMSVFPPLEHLARLILQNLGAEEDPESLDLADPIRNAFEDLFTKLDDVLQVAVKKQQTWLTIENTTNIINSMSKCLKMVATEVPNIAQITLAAANVTWDEVHHNRLEEIIPYAWKFTTLNRFLRYGKMELRVSGVEQLSSELVSAYRAHIHSIAGGYDHYLVQFLVKFLRSNNMTSYLVSVDSHPTLAERAANLVGFLMVARQYTQDDTDCIWDVVKHGQDPRMIDAALKLLSGCFTTFELQEYHHLCNRILELPYERVDERVLNFSLSALQGIRQKTAPTGGLFDSSYDAVTWRLCFRFVREGLTPARCTNDQATFIRRELLPNLIIFVQPSRIYSHDLSISDDEQNELARQIQADLESFDDCACGSAYALHELFSILTLNHGAAVKLAEQCALPHALIENLANLSGQVKDRNDLDQVSVGIQLESRLLCLLDAMKLVPDRINHEMISRIWTSILTAEHLPDHTRTQAWNHLTLLMRQARPPNAVVSTILTDFWPLLRPSLLNKATLDFAKQSVTSQATGKNQISDNDATVGEVIEIPGIERLWNIMLSCHPNTIEVEATDFIIHQYLKSSVIVRRSRSDVHETHLWLIDRSVNQVISSAERLKSFADTGSRSDVDDGMVIIASEDEIRSEELKFDRSLLFLRGFTNALKKDPSSSPVAARQSEELPPFENKKGKIRDVSLRIHANKYVADAARFVSVGEENNGAELGEYISNLTGWTQFTTICAGRRINLQDETSTLSALSIFAGTGLMITKSTHTEERLPRSYRASSPVDAKILLHFDSLFGLLDSENRLAKEVYDFLRTTSVRDKISDPIKSMQTPAQQLLPCEKPYKTLFCTEALKACIEFEYFSNNPDTDFVLYAVSALNHAFLNVSAIGYNDPLNMSVTLEILDTLLMACRIKVPRETSLAYFQSSPGFVDRISEFIACAQQRPIIDRNDKGSEVLIKIALDLFLEACLHDENLWPPEGSEGKLQAILRQCMLFDDRENVRKCIVDAVLNLNGSTGAKVSFKVSNPHTARARFDAARVDASLSHLWKTLYPVLSTAAQKPTCCQDLFEASLIILRVVGKSFSSENLQSIFDHFSAMLVQHSHHELVGQFLWDRLIPGTTKLLCEVARLLRNRSALPSQAELMSALLQTFLFPPLSDGHDDLRPARAPVLDSPSRQYLYELLLILCQDKSENDALRAEISHDFVERDYFAPQSMHDRLALRSPVGYAGLRNLSNTCYLNSLLSQLFMHVQFRDLLLNTAVVDTERQRLLVELRKVFAYMQSSHDKAVDPQTAVESIVTYEGGEIDVSVQMDVDEFFNLLFDRLEGQLIDERSRAYFKSLYGGETIQQIKSMECEHISERAESFAVLPVEIKGKARLEESLKAYVDGEVLQGDNKYSCTACGRHVDAVKRNCLKEVPDSVIFNLKRFDYDIMSGTRCKLNDFFSFPEELDVAPYTLQNLSKSDGNVEPDIFELTGIIVHSGTADSGHYFSYIRQRPSGKGRGQSWVQFNDSDVTYLDPLSIQDIGFGGPDSSCYGLVKFYSAYMLFYQRRSSILRTEEQFRHTDPIEPLRIPADESLEHHISQQNELLLRAYCVQDEGHARFVRELIERLWSESEDGCSEGHAIENRALRSTLDYVQQISSRWKGQPEMEETLRIVTNFIIKCSTCAKTVCEWITDNNVIQDSMVRCPYAATRKAFCMLLKVDLETLHRRAKEECDFVDQYRDLLYQCLEGLSRTWDQVLRHARAWAEYFWLLRSVLQLGEIEVSAMKEYSFLEDCLGIIRLSLMEPSEIKNTRRTTAAYQPYVIGREKNRLFNHAVLIDFFTELFLHHDLRRSSLLHEQDLARDEQELLGIARQPYRLEWLRRIIQGRWAPLAALKLVERVAQHHDLAGAVSQILSQGAEHKNMVVAVAFLEPVVTFSRFGVHENQIIDLVGSVLDSTQTIDLGYGSEYLQFIQSLLESKNDIAELPTGFLADKILTTMPDWAAVLVVAPNETNHDVRNETLAIIQQLLLDPIEKYRTEDPQQYQALLQIANSVVFKAMHYARSTFSSRSKDSSMHPGQVDQLAALIERLLELLNADGAIAEDKRNDILGTLTALRVRNQNMIETLSPENWQESSDPEASEEFEDFVSP